MNAGVHLRSSVWRISMAACSVASEQNSFRSTPSSSPSLRSTPRSSARRNLAAHFVTDTEQHSFLSFEKPCKSDCTARARPPVSKCPAAVASCHENIWRSLGIDQSELSLALTLTTGQSFRWKLTGDSEYTGVVDRYLFTLRQCPNGVEYMRHGIDARHPPASHTSSVTHTSPLINRVETTISRCDTDTSQACHDAFNHHLLADQAELSLKNYLNLCTFLKDVWAPFITADARFAALAPHMAGARLLRQSPLECLFQFICSSNNHIQRISQMVDHLASLGPYLGTVADVSFHAFPSLDTLAKVTEAELRKAGFGYRAKYIVGAVRELQSKEGGGEAWLYSLRKATLSNALEELCSIPGIGPKVAACIALFSLDQHHAIPVDTHVWQIATTYITPELAGERLTPKLHAAVSEAFVKRFGEYAGWAQNVLFIAELSSHQVYLPEHLRTTREKKLKVTSRKKAKTLES